MAWRMSCLRDVHPIGDTLGEIAYHASISVAFIVETIKITRRVAAQPARRTHPAAAVSGRAGRLKQARISCVSLAETAAEKMMALTRRIAMDAGGPEPRPRPAARADPDGGRRSDLMAATISI
ncbi:MAG TPA: hypothetical protein VKI44_24330 [Acetobacteraceae bacterium]|nr:hypothetical protein [Acetobacteraceae bacterium]